MQLMKRWMIEALSLRGRERQHLGRGMWRLLCKTAKAKTHGDWKLVCSGVKANKTGKAHRTARYRFSGTYSQKNEAIDGVFKCKRHGLIARHRIS